MTGRNKKTVFLLVVSLFAFSMLGCVDQSGGEVRSSEHAQTEKLEQYKKEGDNLKIVATSVAVMQICEKLDVDLVGVPKSDLVDIPKRYSKAESVGSPMSPDLEILSSISPDWVLSPSSLASDLQPKYEAAGLAYAFLNLKSIPGMFQSIKELGMILDREEQSQKMLDEYESFYETYQGSHQGKTSPTVLILMGLPGSYVVATENSYVGSLVEMAGGTNVYAGTEEEFLNINTEDMLEKQPDIILRTAHAMPESVMEMFAEEFETNDVWKHFRAVEYGQVYDLSNEQFGMSANFNYQDALDTLDRLFYAEHLILGGQDE